MKKHAVIIHWLIDYVSLARGTVQGYFYKTPPPHYKIPPNAKKTPLILLPGLSLRWGFLKSLGDFLTKNGYPIYLVPALKNNVTSVEESAKMVREIIEKNNLHTVVIIGHSKGGIVGKYLLIHLNNDDRVKGIIALAT